MLEEHDHVTGFRNSPVASEGDEKNVMLVANPNVDNLSEMVDDDDDLDFYGAIGGESAQGVCLRPKLLALQDECPIKKRRVPMNVAEVVELEQETLQSTDVSFNTVPSS